MFDYQKATEEFSHIDKDWKEMTREQRQIAKEVKFFLKIWDNHGESLPPGHAIIAILSKIFPNDADCKSYFPMGSFKDLDGMTHEEIYNKWVARLEEPLVNANGKTTTIKNVSGAYMLKKWKEEFGTELTVEQVSRAMSLRFYRGSAGMVEEARTHQDLTELYKGTIYGYKPATHEDESTGIDGYSYLLSNPNKRIHLYSIKNFWALSDTFVNKSREDVYWPDGKLKYRGKKAPTHYVGRNYVSDKSLTFKEVGPGGKVVTMFGPPVKK